MPDDPETRPLFDVTRAEFRRRAEAAGWEERTLELLLVPQCPVTEPIGMGQTRLRIIDWPTVANGRRTAATSKMARV